MKFSGVVQTQSRLQSSNWNSVKKLELEYQRLALLEGLLPAVGVSVTDDSSEWTGEQEVQKKPSCPPQPQDQKSL